MSVLKDFRFSVDVRPDGDRLVDVTNDDGLSLAVCDAG
jgi:hypothetical protein